MKPSDTNEKASHLNSFTKIQNLHVIPYFSNGLCFFFARTIPWIPNGISNTGIKEGSGGIVVRRFFLAFRTVVLPTKLSREIKHAMDHTYTSTLCGLQNTLILFKNNGRREAQRCRRQRPLQFKRRLAMPGVHPIAHVVKVWVICLCEDDGHHVTAAAINERPLHKLIIRSIPNRDARFRFWEWHTEKPAKGLLHVAE